MSSYRIYEGPADHSFTGGIVAEAMTYDELPARIRAAIDADPNAEEWKLPALSDGDSGEEVEDIEVLVTVAEDQ